MYRDIVTILVSKMEMFPSFTLLTSVSWSDFYQDAAIKRRVRVTCAGRQHKGIGVFDWSISSAKWHLGQLR